MTLDQSILQILTNTQTKIRANMQAAGINASGRTSASIQVRKTADGYALVGGGGKAAPLQTLEIGRPPGKIPYNFAEILKEWANAKGLDINPWAVAMTIKHYGTERWRDPSKRRDIYSTPSRQAAEELQSTISGVLFTEIRQIIQSNFK